MRHAIGITLACDTESAARFTIREDYLRSVDAAGGLPLILPPWAPGGDLGALLDRVRGLLLTGGTDIDPSFYGAANHEKLGQVFRDRDDFEIALCREALARDMPVLAICRGIQVLNVATGGTLVQDIPSEISGALNHDAPLERWQVAHDVDVLPGTRLRGLLGRKRVAVNSFHHQAVGKLGEGLVLSARSCTDGVVEGVEAPGRRFVVGVQWHPEGFWRQSENFAPLFDALVGGVEGP